MNVRKNIDYSALFAAVDKAVRAALPQMKLYWEIGRLVCERPEKGAAVAVAEHLQTEFPDAKGFSPRNVRRMREFYRSYTEAPALLAEAMCLGWTQNVVILEADLPLTERAWYIHAALKNGWSKLALAENIDRCTHNKDVALDTEEDPGYNAFEEKHLKDCADESASRQPQKYLQNSGRLTQAGRAQHRLRRKDGPSAVKRGLYPIRLMIGMGGGSLRDIRHLCGGPKGKLHLLLEYADRPDFKTAGPWYIHDFEATWRDVEESRDDRS